VLLPTLSERITLQAKLLRLLFLAVDGAEERATFGGEHGLRGFSVAELAAPMSIASGFQHAA
jgi:hypothetical protein